LHTGNENSGAITISSGNWGLPETDELVALDPLRPRSLRCFTASVLKSRIGDMVTIRTFRVEISRMNLIVSWEYGEE
jgi:hypothetical protein